MSATKRKPHVLVSMEQVLAIVKDKDIASVTEVARELDISVSTARRKLDAWVYRGDVIRDEYDEDGIKLPATQWRYGYYPENKVYDHQTTVIQERFGQEAADSANYGWGAEDGCINTKVYGHGVLTTWFDEDGEVTDEEFEERS